MKIAVLGTGMVGRALAGGLSRAHVVTIGTRDAAEGRARLSAWLADHPEVEVAELAAAAASAELVVNALNGAAALEGLEAAGAENLAGKVLVDVANPLDADGGFPPALFVSNIDSLGERIQGRFPDARVVKTLNTLNCELMVDPGRLAGRRPHRLCERR